MNVVPFELGDVYGGLANCHGLLRLEGDQLSLEFQIQEAVLGVLKGDIRELRIPLEDLSRATLESTWFGLSAQLVLQFTRMDAVSEIPGITQGRLVLGINRKNREAAERFVADIQAPRKGL